MCINQKNLKQNKISEMDGVYHHTKYSLKSCPFITYLIIDDTLPSLEEGRNLEWINQQQINLSSKRFSSGSNSDKCLIWNLAAGPPSTLVSKTHGQGFKLPPHSRHLGHHFKRGFYSLSNHFSYTLCPFWCGKSQDSETVVNSFDLQQR